MLKWFNKKKKDNKGFTLVELIIVVAILAILVGILAPQYTKYVERSRKAADVSNLENIVSAVKVAVADYDALIPDTATVDVTITIVNTAAEGAKTTVVKYGTTDVSGASSGGAGALLGALNEYAGTDWQNVKLKSGGWKQDGDSGAEDTIGATCTISDTGSVSVVYNPASIKTQLKDE